MRSKSDELPEPVRDLKRALNKVVARRFPSLRQMASQAEISADTASRALNGPDVPTPKTFQKILIACRRPPLDDGRYDNDWNKLYRAAYESAKSATTQRWDRATRNTNTNPAVGALLAQPYVHNGHSLLGTMRLTSRAHESEELNQWQEDRLAAESIMCIAGPGGQGKSALVWDHFLRTQSSGIRIWHGFGHDSEHSKELLNTLAEASRALLGEATDQTVAIARLRQRMSSVGGLIVLDAIENLYGISSRLIDALSPRFRTIADPFAEEVIRSFASVENVKIIITCRVTPAFIDDPAIRPKVRRIDLPPIDPALAGPFWSELQISGAKIDFATATAALHGSPILMRLVARRIVMRRSGNIKEWLLKDEARIRTDGDEEVTRLLAPQQILNDLSEPARRMLLLLAVSRRRLTGRQWRDLAAGRLFLGMRRSSAERDADDETDERLDEAIYALQEADLVHREEGDEYEVHELLADAVIQSAGEEMLSEAYRSLQSADGELYFPGMGWNWTEVTRMGDPRELATNIGRFLSFLDRKAYDSASHILGAKLYPALRHNLGDLRQLRALVASYELARIRAGITDAEPLYGLDLALADGNWQEALDLLGESDRKYLDANDLTHRAIAQSGLSNFDEAYRDATAAWFHGLRSSTLERAVEDADFMTRDDSGILWGSAIHCAGYHEHVEAALALSETLRYRGYYRVGLLVALDSFPSGHVHPGQVTRHWLEIAALLSQSGRSAMARRAFEFAERSARADGINEVTLQVRITDLELKYDAGIEITERELVELLVVVTRSGHGALAHRLLSLCSDNSSQRTLFASIAWQYGIDVGGVSRRSTPPEAAHNLLDEVDRLADLRNRGQWVELRILIERPWKEELSPGRWTELAEINRDRGDDRDPRQAERELIRELWSDVLGFTNEDDVAVESWINRVGLEADDTDGASNADPAQGYRLAVDQLDLLEDLMGAASLLSKTWRCGDPDEAFDRLLSAVFYEPNGYNFEADQPIRAALIEAGHTCARLPEVAWILTRMMDTGWDRAVLALEIANIWREVGDFERAVWISMFGTSVVNALDRAGIAILRTQSFESPWYSASAWISSNWVFRPTPQLTQSKMAWLAVRCFEGLRRGARDLSFSAQIRKVETRSARTLRLAEYGVRCARSGQTHWSPRH